MDQGVERGRQEAHPLEALGDFPNARTIICLRLAAGLVGPSVRSLLGYLGDARDVFLNPGHISNQLIVADGDAPDPALTYWLRVLDVLSSEPPRFHGSLRGRVVRNVSMHLQRFLGFGSPTTSVR